MNAPLAAYIVSEAIRSGVNEFCVCPGKRNAPLYLSLMQAPSLRKYHWYEERSAAFFALGRARATGRPVAVVVTSGTAAGELLPAAMEAYYTGVPLLLITADRPRRFRGSNAPQCAEQVGLYGIYTPFSFDIAAKEEGDLAGWDCRTPAHLNVCFEEPFAIHESREAYTPMEVVLQTRSVPTELSCDRASEALDTFLKQSENPLVIVGTLPVRSRLPVAEFLLRLKAPVLLEGVSGLREDPRLQDLRIKNDNLWLNSAKAGYPIDGVLRIGGIPTIRLWRDLEDKKDQVAVCSLSEHPFSGLSWAEGFATSLARFLPSVTLENRSDEKSQNWRQADQRYAAAFQKLCDEEPTAEVSLVRALSKAIPKGAHIYLGNSLPIREWDQAACNQDRGFHITASRGLNGIDGQLSTFLGLCQPGQENWVLLGDLTILYDMAGPWILSQLTSLHVNIVVINNSGGQFFVRFLNEPEFLNTHNLTFAPLADLWGLHYERWEQVPLERTETIRNRLVEVVPDLFATKRFNDKLSNLSCIVD